MTRTKIKSKHSLAFVSQRDLAVWTESEFELIYKANQGLVRQVLFRMIYPERPDDLAQETFVRAWKAQHQFDGRSQLKTWLVRIAINVARDHLRWKKRWSWLGWNAPTSLIEQESAQDDRQTDELAEIIQLCISKLSALHQECFTLYYQVGLSVDEVAESLEVPVGTVKSRLANAREKFKKYLAEQGVSYES